MPPATAAATAACLDWAANNFTITPNQSKSYTWYSAFSIIDMRVYLINGTEYNFRNEMYHCRKNLVSIPPHCEQTGSYKTHMIRKLIFIKAVLTKDPEARNAMARLITAGPK